jgi:hypothetical protein
MEDLDEIIDEVDFFHFPYFFLVAGSAQVAQPRNLFVI